MSVTAFSTEPFFNNYIINQESGGSLLPIKDKIVLTVKIEKTELEDESADETTETGVI